MPRASAAPTILKAAQACLIEGGGAFEMRDVTDRAGVSEGLVYHYFKSKAGLLRAIVDDFYARYAAVVNRETDGAEPWLTREEARMRDAVQFLYDDPMARIILGGMNRLPEAAQAEMAQRRDIAERSIRNVRSGMKQGVIPANIDPSVAGPASIGAMNQVVMHALAQDPVPDQAQIADELWRIIKAIMGIKDG